jgi:hypothetical protein
VNLIWAETCLRRCARRIAGHSRLIHFAIMHRSVVGQAGCLVIIGEGIYRGDAVRIDMKLK